MDQRPFWVDHHGHNSSYNRSLVMLYCLYYQCFTILIGNFDSLVLLLLIQRQLISEFMMLHMETQHAADIYLW